MAMETDEAIFIINKNYMDKLFEFKNISYA